MPKSDSLSQCTQHPRPQMVAFQPTNIRRKNASTSSVTFVGGSLSQFALAADTSRTNRRQLFRESLHMQAFEVVRANGISATLNRHLSDLKRSRRHVELTNERIGNPSCLAVRHHVAPF